VHRFGDPFEIEPVRPRTTTGSARMTWVRKSNQFGRGQSFSGWRFTAAWSAVSSQVCSANDQ